MAQLALNFTLNSESTFDNFIVGDNQELVQILKTLADLQCCYIVGEKSSGKTHLLQAVCHQANQGAVYLPLSQFIEGSPEILQGLENLELVCIDDIEVIANKTAWEEAFFHAFNAMRQSGTKLIVASCGKPKSIGIALPDLMSRLTWGATYRIQPLSDDDKIKLLQQNAKQRGLDVSDEVAAYIVTHCSRSLADLLSFLDKLDQASLEEKRRITIPFVKKNL